MMFLTSVIFLIVSQSIVGSGARNLQAESVSPTMNYWHEKLPMTPIPNAILKLVSPVSSSPTIFNTFVNRTDVASHRHISGHGYKLQSSDEQILANPSVSIVLLEKDFQIGRKVTLDLAWKNSPDAYFLPRTQTDHDKMPFSSKKLSLALEDLKIPQGSEMAVAMKQTLEKCELPTMNGETKFCADSLESMIDYTTSKLGTNHVNVLALDVPHSSKSVKKQQYSVVAFPFQTQYASKTVVCHRETYAYAVYYCHEVGATRAMQVSLKGEDGSSLQGVGVCHANTSTWNPQHELLKVLNVKPGGPAVCHFIMRDGIVWVPYN